MVMWVRVNVTFMGTLSVMFMFGLSDDVTPSVISDANPGNVMIGIKISDATSECWLFCSTAHAIVRDAST